MSMTREQAIKHIEDIRASALKNLGAKYAHGCEGYYRTRIELSDICLTALRPVSREQVEEAWRGEWVPAESDFDDYDTLFDVEDWCDWQCSACHNEICYDDPMERKWLPKFCPNCGAPMTDEAVQMVMERLEQIKCKY